MKSVLGLLLLSLVTTYANASWQCELQCKRSVDTIFLTIERHASGQDYSDFNAECKNLGGGSTFPGQSGCEYVYCKKYSSTVEILTGSGESLTEARQSARSGCHEPGSNSCGIMNYYEIGEYNCKQQ